MIDPTFRNINRLLVLSFKIGNNDFTKLSFDKYYIPLVEIKDFNVLIDSKLFFDQPVKNKQEAYEKAYDYTTGNVLDYFYHQKYYKFNGIDLSRQTNTIVSQQINFVGKVEEEDVAAIFFIADKQQKTI